VHHEVKKTRVREHIAGDNTAKRNRKHIRKRDISGAAGQYHPQSDMFVEI
jgi:hypothetical protein